MNKSVLHRPGLTWFSTVFLLAAVLCTGGFPGSGGGTVHPFRHRPVPRPE
jgi:hypothetical protein